MLVLPLGLRQRRHLAPSKVAPALVRGAAVSIMLLGSMMAVPARFSGLLRYATLGLGLGAIFLAGTLLHPQFLTIANQRDVLGQVSINGILAVGMTLVILSAGIDLSVGSVLSLCTVVCAILLMERGDSIPLWRASVLVCAGCLGFAAPLLWRGIARLRRGAQGRSRAVPAILLLLGAVLVATGVVLAVIPRGGLSTWMVLILVPLVGGLMGGINGLIVARTRLQPFIVTLAMMLSAFGLAKYVAGQGGQIHAIYRGDSEHSGAPASFERLGGTILTVGHETLRSGKERELKLLPVPGLFLLASWAAAAFLVNLLPLGRYVLAVGGNEEAARLAGVPVARVKVFAYTASGLLAGLAAVFYCAQYTQGKPDAGMGKELDAIAAVVIGGTSLMGGRGSVLGTLVGVMIFGYLTNILQLRAVSTEIQDILKGVIIVGAAAAQTGDLGGLLRRLVPRRSPQQTRTPKE